MRNTRDRNCDGRASHEHDVFTDPGQPLIGLDAGTRALRPYGVTAWSTRRVCG
jgi:hypothetical protein